MRSVPRLGWLNIKTHPQSGLSRKNRPGRKPEHTQAQTYALYVIAQKEMDVRLGIYPPAHAEARADLSFLPGDMRQPRT